VNLADPSAWTACTPAQEEASQINCIYAGCERPPRTLCLTPSFCDAVGCGGAEFDENGCRRLPCASDAECGADERCTLTVVQPMPCTPANGSACECAPTAPGIGNMGSFSNSVASVGQRGAWTQLEVQRVDGFSSCPTIPCASNWRIGADGGVMASRQGQPVTSALSVEDLDRLRLIADGPELRTALRDGITCGPSSTETNITIRLEFGSETLERVATGCVTSGPTGNVFERLYKLVERY
jgi:hypothetical protein